MTIIYTSPMYHHQAKRALKADSRAQVGLIAGQVLNRLMGFASDIGQQKNQEQYTQRLMAPLMHAMTPNSSPYGTPGANPFEQMASGENPNRFAESMRSIAQMSGEHDPSVLQRFGFGATPQGIPPQMAMQAMTGIAQMAGKQKYADPLEREGAMADIEYKRSLTGEATARSRKMEAEIEDRIGQSARLSTAMQKLNAIDDDDMYDRTILNHAPAQVALGLGITDVGSDEFKTLTQAIEFQQKRLEEGHLADAQREAMEGIEASEADPEQAIGILDSVRQKLADKGLGRLSEKVESKALQWLDLLMKGDARKADRQAVYQAEVTRTQSQLKMLEDHIEGLTQKIAMADVQPKEMAELTSTWGRGTPEFQDAVDEIRRSRAPLKAQLTQLTDTAKARKLSLLKQEWKAKMAQAKGSAKLDADEEGKATEYSIVQEMLQADTLEDAEAIWAKNAVLQTPRGAVISPMPVDLENEDDTTFKEVLTDWLASLDPESLTRR